MFRSYTIPLLAAFLLLAALPGRTSVAAADAPDVPVPPEFALPPPATQDAVIVANDPDRFAGLERRGYRVYADITQALARVPEGGSIYITAGTYREDLYLHRLSGVDLIGEEGALVIADHDRDACLLYECSDIRIHNIDMVHEIGESPCLHNCIVVWDCSDVLVEYCDLSGCGYIGVEVLGNGDPHSVRVEYCAIHDCEEAFYDVPGGVLTRRGNVLWDNGDDPWNPTGWREGEMFGSERQPHMMHDANFHGERAPAANVPQASEVTMPPAGTPGLIVVPAMK